VIKGPEQVYNGERETEGEATRGAASPLFRFFTLFLILSVFWIVLSGRFGVQPAILLILSVGAVTYFNADRFYRKRFISLWHFTRYAVWLLYNIIRSNLQVAYLVLHPRMPIRPRLLQFRTTYQRDGSQAMLANSITMTPGTVTVDVQDGRFVVHALVKGTASGLVTGRFQNMVGAVFGEQPEPVPEVTWAKSVKELS
jgi:multicomponent Na+:H+ antiporter subunit E